MAGSERVVVESDEMIGSTKNGRLGGKRKRVLASSKSIDDSEDVCFICLDGGSLILCDHRDCPKAYHPHCINVEETRFRNEARWNCAGHICNNCEKTAKYMCYTCAYSLCTRCIKEAEFFRVRRSKGFCEPCMKMVMWIEDGELRNNEKSPGDFDDVYSWEHHFKDYWINLNNKLSITLYELRQARNPWKRVSFSANDGESAANGITEGPGSDSPLEDLEVRNSKRRKTKRQLESSPKDGPAELPRVTNVYGKSALNSTNWASKELLEFVAYMKNGDISFLSQLDVRAVLLEYIRRNNLRDPCQKSYIVCDSRLENLFGKAHLRHFEMLRLLDSHLLTEEDDQADYVKNRTSDAQICLERQEVQAIPIMDQACNADSDRAKHDADNEAYPENCMSLRVAGSSAKRRKQITPRRICSTAYTNLPEALKNPTAASRQDEHAAGKDSLGNGCGLDSSGRTSESSLSRGSNGKSYSLHKLRNQVAASSADADAGNAQAIVRFSESAQATLSGGLVQSSNDRMTDKMWHYKDHTGKTQGPFSMLQLHKWSTTSHFPANLMIWKTKENQEVSITLVDALNGKLA